MNAGKARAGLLGALKQTKVITPEMFDAYQKESARDIDLAELYIDSLSIFDFCLLIEEELGVEIEPEDVINNSTLSSLVDFLATKS